MRSRASKLTVCAIVWLAVGASAYFIFTSEQSIAAHRSALRVFDLRAHEASGALAEIRAAQQAYVAAGQGVAFWMPKVSALLDTATSAVGLLRESAASPGALVSIVAATSAIDEFAAVDARARDYLQSRQPLMASDIVFTEGGEASAAAARHVDAASAAEHQEFDVFEARQRMLELYALAAAGGVGALMMLVLALTGSAPASPRSSPVVGLQLSAAASADLGRAETRALKAAANICTEFARVKDLDDLAKLVARAADLMGASGLIVWLGNASGADLRPAIAQGYQPQALARMPSVPRSADNAAAAAYRTGKLQIVLSRPGSARGALVAPLLSPDGCIGALAAEIKEGGEVSDTAQALAAIFAAELAGVLSGWSAAAEPQPVERAANS